VERILDEETILKTPRRTRKRRDFSAAANKNRKKAEVKTADVADEVETEAATEEKKLVEAKPTKKEAPVKAAPQARAEPAVAEANEVTSAGDADSSALKAVEAFAGRVDTDPILNDLFKNVSDTKMLDLMEALFRSAFSVPGAPALETAYMALIRQPHLGDDHFVAAATAMHAVLTELGVSNDESDRVMQVIDQSRIKLLDS